MKIPTQGSTFNYKLFFAVLLLLIIGLIVIYSVSYQDPGMNNFQRQLIWAGLGLIVFFITSRVDYGFFQNNARILYIISFILLIIVLVVGTIVGGSKAWISIGPFHIQPVEVAKAAIILLLAKYFSKLNKDDKRSRHILISLIYVLIPTYLTLRQPDLGSAVVLLGIWIVMVINWELKKRDLIVLTMLILASLFLAWPFLGEHQKKRMECVIDPSSDPSGYCYHMIQAMTAIGSGGLYGKGLGYGAQTQLHFLPEAHTDFIFAVIGEEMGLIGSAILMLIFIYVFFELYQIAKNSPDNFGRYFVGGVMAMFFIQMILNIGMNLGNLPVIGLPLPFVSYGGSALIIEFFLLGIVFNIHTQIVKSKSLQNKNFELEHGS
jgi:rod shape determining protein RodA